MLIVLKVLGSHSKLLESAPDCDVMVVVFGVMFEVDEKMIEREV